MARLRALISEFTGGEVSPEMWGRVQTDQYPSMLEELRNVISNPRGGAERRKGLHYVRETKFPALNSRLIPFIFSREQSYMLEFGDYYVRFYKDNGWVEDIGDVTTYLGDGTSVSFVYPHPTVLEADIEIYDKDGVLIAPTEYTITAIDPATNYALPFDDAGWDLDLETAGSPWTLAGTQVTSPDGVEALLAYPNAQIPIGGAYKYTVDVISFSASSQTVVDTNTTDVPLTSGDPLLTIATAIATEDVLTETVDIAVQCQFEDTSGTQTSDFSWELRHNTTVISSGVQAAVGAPGFLLTVNTTLTPMYQDDTLSLHVSAVGNHVQSLPQITGTTADTSVSLTYLINPAAQLAWSIYGDAATNPVYDVVDPVLGTLTMVDTETTSSAPAPYTFSFIALRGLQVTLDNPVLQMNNEGYFIAFNTAPVLGDIIRIMDKSAQGSLSANRVNHTRLAPGPTTELIFEIQSPFGAEHLENLYYVQANDIMVICHDEFKPRELTRYNAYDWRFEQNEFTDAIWEDVAYNPLFGYPRTVAYFQERLYFGGTIAQPQTLWGSRSADFHIFTLPGDADPFKPDDPVEYTIAAYTHEAIEWLSPERVLIIGTSQTEHRLAPDQYIATDRLPSVSRMSAYGGAHVMPAFMGNLTVFVQAIGNQVRSYEQSGASVIEKWESIELDWMAGHLTAPKVKQLAYALIPDSQLQMVTLAGDMLSMTYEPGMGEKQQVGWSKHTTDGNFKSINVIPEDDKDQTWVIVEREGKRYVEYFDDKIFTDATLTYPDVDFPNDPPLQSVGGLGYLEGKTVTIKADGATHPDLVVVDGTVELNGFYSKIAIGLKYTPRIKLQRLSMNGQPANLQGMKGRWVEVWLRLNGSAYPLVDGRRAAERRPSTPMDEVEPIVTADVKVYHLGFDRNKQLIIEQDLPVPMNITAVFGVIEVGQG